MKCPYKNLDFQHEDASALKTASNSLRCLAKWLAFYFSPPDLRVEYRKQHTPSAEWSTLSEKMRVALKSAGKPKLFELFSPRHALVFLSPSDPRYIQYRSRVKQRIEWIFQHSSQILENWQVSPSHIAEGQPISVNAFTSKITTPLLMELLHYPDDFSQQIFQNALNSVSSPISWIFRRNILGDRRAIPRPIVEGIGYALGTEDEDSALLEIANILPPMVFIQSVVSSSLYQLCKSQDNQTMMLPFIEEKIRKQFFLDILRMFPPSPILFRDSGHRYWDLTQIYASTSYAEDPAELSQNHPPPTGIAGSGYRRCPGTALGIHVIRTIIEKVVQRYTLYPGTLTHKAHRFGFHFAPDPSNTILLQERQQ